MKKIINAFLHRITFVAIYSALSFVIWVYKRWITNGDISTFSTYMTTVYGIAMSLMAIAIGWDILPDCNGNTIKLRGALLPKMTIVLLLPLSLYFGFAMSGWYSVFLSGITFNGILKIVIVSAWCFPQLVSYIYIIRVLNERVQRNVSLEIDGYLTIKLFIFAFIIWNLIYIGLWPGGLPYDANLEIDMALGNVPFSSWQPYLHTYLVRIALALGNHISMFFLLQISFEAILLASYFGYLHKKRGINKKVIYAVFAFLILQMPLFCIGMELLRDSIFSLAFAWLVFLLIVYEDDRIGEVKLYYVQLFVAFFLVVSMRSNGIVVLTILLPFLIWRGIRKDKKLLFLSLLVAVIVILINGPFAKMAGVERETRDSFLLTSMIDDMKAVNYFGGELTEDAHEYLESIKIDSVQHWYDDFSEWQSQRTYDATTASTIRVMKYYFTTLFHNPYYVIRNRLTKSSIIWEVFGHGERYIESYMGVNTRDGYYFFEREENSMTPISNALRNITTSLCCDFITLRSGLALVLILLLFGCSNNRKKYCLAALPIIANVAALIFSLNFHERRFSYWINLCFMVIILYEICTVKKVNNEKEEII